MTFGTMDLTTPNLLDGVTTLNPYNPTHFVGGWLTVTPSEDIISVDVIQTESTYVFRQPLAGERIFLGVGKPEHLRIHVKVKEIHPHAHLHLRWEGLPDVPGHVHAPRL